MTVMMPRNHFKALTVVAVATAAGLLAQSSRRQAEPSRPTSATTASSTSSDSLGAPGTRIADAKTRGQNLLAALERPGINGYPPETIAPHASDAPPEMFGYSTIVVRFASEYGVPTALVDSVIRVESNYKPKSRGKAGEIGLMQIKLGTARLVGYSGSARGLFDPETNIRYGIKYLAKAYGLADGDTCGTILRYNAGHGAKRMNRVSAAVCEKVKRAQSEHYELVAQYRRVLTSGIRRL